MVVLDNSIIQDFEQICSTFLKIFKLYLLDTPTFIIEPKKTNRYFNQAIGLEPTTKYDKEDSSFYNRDCCLFQNRQKMR